MQALDDFVDDWRGSWLSLILVVGVFLVFSEAWQAPLFGYTTEDQASSGVLIRYIYYPFYVAGLVVATLSWRRVLDATWRTPLILALLALAAASYFWSSNPPDTLRRFVALAMTMLCAYAVAARFSWRRLSEAMAIAFAIMMVASVILAVAFPQMGRMQDLFVGAWRGVWQEKNNLGAYMALGFVAAAAAALHNPKRRVFWGIVAVMMIAVVVLSTSKTALVSVVLGIGGILFIYFAQRGPIIGIIMIWLAVTVLLTLGALILLFPDHMFQLLGKDATLTGRTFIWDGISRVMEKRPLLGYGYGSVWSDESEYAPLAKITQVAGFRAYHAHSCWYEMWLGLGVVGLGLWALVFAESWIKALFRTYRGDAGFFALPLLGLYSLSSLTESMALNWNDLRWCLFVLVYVKVSLADDQDSEAAF